VNLAALAQTGVLAEAIESGPRDAEAQARLRRAQDLVSLPNGIYADVPHDLYHARVIDFVSKGACDRIEQAPAIHKAWADGLRPEPSRPAMNLGTAVHMAILEPARFARTYVIEPDFGPSRKTDECSSERAKENKTRRDEWRRMHAHATLLPAGTGEDLLGMVKSLLAHPLARKLLEQGLSEVTAIGTCPITGLKAKSRSDHLVERIGTIADLKTTEDASPDGFKRSVARFRYHVQDPLYRTVFRASGLEIANFCYIAVEKSYPYLVAVHALDEAAFAAGQVAWQRNATTLARCLETNTWPGYEPRIHSVSLPPWAM
jgi:exodeoxyribonuclease VIII